MKTNAVKGCLDYLPKEMELRQELDKNILKYKDLSKPIQIDNRANSEKFVYYKWGFTIDKILVRSSVARMLASANQLLKECSNFSLKVLCGYRSLDEQTKRFDEVCAKLKQKNPDISQDELFEMAHKFIAVPTVAGHPTGGAVDVTLTNKTTGEIIDMGSEYCDFDDINVYAKSPFVTKQIRQNRELLRKIMMSAGFAPFDGEWWHFSYGDKEWAMYYGQKSYLYQQVELQQNDERIISEEIFNFLGR